MLYYQIIQFTCCLWEDGRSSLGDTTISIFRSPLGRIGCGKRLYLCGVTFLGFQSPCTLTQSWKRYSWNSSRARNRSSVQIFHSMLLGSSAFRLIIVCQSNWWSLTWPCTVWAHGSSPPATKEPETQARERE